ncbi:MAG: COX15/CtaA family protein, partial [Acidobacteriota bacterium]
MKHGRGNTQGVATWLAICALMVLGMTVLGGATRLTHSGLSIVEWQPIVGTLPPLSDADWNTTFDKYKQTPEYKQVNQGMSLDAFKGIFWWEYFHRSLGRTIGFVFLLPLLYFWWRSAITPPLARVLVGIFILGGLQGFMGWYMV